MPAVLQFSLQLFISVLTSAAVWVAVAVYLISIVRVRFGFGELINPPASESAKIGLKVGLIHGLLNGLLLGWYKPDSFSGFAALGVLTTEISIILGFAGGFLYVRLTAPPATDNAPPIKLVEAFGFIFINAIGWFAILSVLFLVPSLAIGLANAIFTMFLRNFS